MNDFTPRSIDSIDKKSKASNLPTLVKHNQKNDHFKMGKKPKIQKFSVAKSDLDSIVSTKISFCSVKVDTADISYNSYLSGEESKKSENIIKISKDFDSNRPNDFITLFTAKCQKCMLVIDCYHLTSNKNCYTNNLFFKLNKDKENKQMLIKQLIDVLQRPTLVRKITSREVQMVVDVFSKNVFHSYPPISSFPPSILFDRVESFRDDAWDQISDIYSFFNSIVTATHIETKTLNHSISSSFVKKLFSCFSSPDDRERSQVLDVLYAIAYRLPDRCPFIFELIKNELVDSISGESSHWGLSQILGLLSKMMASIPQFFIGFLRSLKTNSKSINDTHDQNLKVQNVCTHKSSLDGASGTNSTSNSIDVLEQAFLSLHQLSYFPSFSSNLFICIDLYMKMLDTERSTLFIDKIIRYFLNHYPVASQKKQIIFLNEIQHIVSSFSKNIFPSAAVKLMIFIGRNLFNSPCIDISEKCLSFVFEEGFSTLINQYYSQIVPIFYVSAHKASKSHHDDSIRSLAIAVLQELSRMNHKLFNVIVTQIRQDNKHKSKNQVSDIQQKQRKNEETVFFFNTNKNSNLNKEESSISRQKTWEMIKEAAKIDNHSIIHQNIDDNYNNENGDGNSLEKSKKEVIDSNTSTKLTCKNVQLSNCQRSSQNNSRIILNSSSFSVSKKNEIDFPSKLIIKKASEINCSKSINLKQEQLFKSQNDIESERKMMKSQPLSASLTNRNILQLSKSPRIKNKAIVKVNGNSLRKSPLRK